MPEHTKEEKKSYHKLNKKNLTDYLENFASKFGDNFGQLDNLWNEADKDQ